MTSQEVSSSNRAPLFDGTNFSFWKIRMRTYLMSLGADVWDVVETGYVKPIILASKDDKLEFTFNGKAMNAILSGLVESEFVKVMHCTSAKEMWDKLISSHEGDEKVKDAKLQVHRLQFEQLKMKDDETVRSYFLRVEELVNLMKGLGEKIDDTFLVRKILRSLTDRFNPKVSAIEELDDLKSMTIDQLLGTLTAYEMRIVKDKSTTREASFKAEKEKMDKESESDTDEIVAKFARRLKKGTGKYQGKLPFKCFNCGKIGHFATKCPYKKKDYESDNQEKIKYKKLNKEKRYQKKSLRIDNNDCSSEDSDSEFSDDDKSNEFMLMVVEDQSDMNQEEAEVDLEGELICALEEIDRLKQKKRKQKDLLNKYEKYEHGSNDILISLKIKLEEAKRIEDILKQQLSEKINECEKLETEVVSVRKELEKVQALYHQNMTSAQATKKLDKILDSQRSPFLKTGLGYEESSNKSTFENTQPIKFVRENSYINENKVAASNNIKSVEPANRIQQSRKYEEKSVIFKNEDKQYQSDVAQGQRYQKFRNPFIPRHSIPRYQTFFYGYCFCCSEFGHKAIECKFNLKNLQNNYQKSYSRIGHLSKERSTSDIHRNPFASLYNEPECYFCHNFGHKASDCRLKL